MDFIWTPEALEVFNSIQSIHYSFGETVEYKLTLMKRVENSISLIGSAIPAPEPFQGHFKTIVDHYIVYYRFSADGESCFIKYFLHSSQIR